MANAPGALSAFLAANRAQFLEDVAKDGAKNWTVVMGNEAGGAFLVYLIMPITQATLFRAHCRLGQRRIGHRIFVPCTQESSYR